MILSFLLFAAVVLFIVLPVLFVKEGKNAQKVVAKDIEWEDHVNSAIDMRNFNIFDI